MPKPERRWWQLAWGKASRNAELDARLNARSLQYQRLREISEWLERHYIEPPVGHHRLQHVLQVMSLLGSLDPEPTTATRIAGLFLCVSDSVMREQLAPLKFSATLIDKASALIRYTRDHRSTEDREEQMMHDADLGIVGLGHELYAEYAKGIRETDRKTKLTSLLERARHGRFFYLIDPIFEVQVVPNLEWELSEVRHIA